MDGQLILAAIRDKLPQFGPEFLEQNTVVELSRDDKLFGLYRLRHCKDGRGRNGSYEGEREVGHWRYRSEDGTPQGSEAR
jgi:hypothetical protein